ncbi:MAG: hypothetical protein JWQ16_1226, partial [Novosphingobium sp.]|nr:hypothetical protein [Novosphingobium sp.]
MSTALSLRARYGVNVIRKRLVHLAIGAGRG